MRAPASELPVMFSEVAIVAADVTILDDISLVLLGGSAPTVLIGPNGSGKTTLLRAAMGLIPVTRGRITWGGRDSGVAAPARHFVPAPGHAPPQHRRQCPLRAGRGRRAARPARRSRTAELLALVGLTGLERRPARRLSGGEQQRLALARALARDPEVLFLDEPTASLDPAATKAIEDIVRAVTARGVKVVMATHDLGEAKRLAGDVVLLHRGRLIENGPAAEFFANPRTQEARKFIAGELLV